MKDISVSKWNSRFFTADGKEIITTRCPIRFNGKRLFSAKPAPQLGEHNVKILHELNDLSVTNNR